jgi:4-hydroxy-2-oxoheptanedioate aldolase
MREPLLAEHAARVGYDYICIDMQHGFCQYGDVRVMLHAAAVSGTAPIVRVPWNEPSMIGRVLDAGALGVIVPLVNDEDDARRVVDACRYPPIGERSFGPVAARVRHGSDYFESADEHVACLPMVETGDAVKNIDAILSISGIDGVYIGPADLSISMGLAPSMDIAEPEIAAALSTVVAACMRHGKVVGIHATASLAAERARAGYRMITVSGDIAPVMQAQREGLTVAREQLAQM